MKIEKIKAILDQDTIDDLEKVTFTELNQKIVSAEQSIKQAQDELEANEKYQELKESLKACRCGFNEVKKRQRAIIEFCLLRLEDKGD